MRRRELSKVVWSAALAAGCAAGGPPPGDLSLPDAAPLPARDHQPAAPSGAPEATAPDAGTARDAGTAPEPTPEQEPEGDAGAPSEAGSAIPVPDAGTTEAARVDAGSPAPTEPDSPDDCPGEPLPLMAAHGVVATAASTAVLSDDWSSTACLAAAGGRDAVYRFTAPGDGKVTITLTPSGYTGALYVREADCKGGREVACSAAPVLNLPATASLEVRSGGVYYVFADQQYGLTQGTFVLEIGFAGDAP